MYMCIEQVGLIAEVEYSYLHGKSLLRWQSARYLLWHKYVPSLDFSLVIIHVWKFRVNLSQCSQYYYAMCTLSTMLFAWNKLFIYETIALFYYTVCIAYCIDILIQSFNCHLFSQFWLPYLYNFYSTQ